MASVSIEKICKSFKATQVLRDVSIDVEDGAFVALVGPSGCGKSTLLRTIAGLEKASSGEIRIGGKTVNNVPPHARDIAMVFQSYALYPHMTVRENMSFGLQLKRTSQPEIDAKVGRAAEILSLGPLLDRLPAQLSGGQRQRVAMGRAIVRDPQVFLFDEPLSNLDAKLRIAMRSEIKALHRRLGTTMIYVTHDQIEAMTMADKIVVMQGGTVEQSGHPPGPLRSSEEPVRGNLHRRAVDEFVQGHRSERCTADRHEAGVAAPLERIGPRRAGTRLWGAAGGLAAGGRRYPGHRRAGRTDRVGNADHGAHRRR